MHVVAKHSISDSDGFYAAAESELANLPAGFTLLSMIPSTDGSQATCLWEAESLDSVRSLVDEKIGHASSNEFYEVDSQNAIGLPVAAA